jgi:pimeloyl-ACP methyl ester carboxylesterase
MARFVLVHGAFYGAWCWERVIPLLRARGHEVFTPTLTGLGERAELLSPAIGLQTHVDDVVRFLHYQNLQEVILVGHSYSGMVVGSAAHRAPERIAHLVYLDAFVPEDGKSLSDIQSERFRKALLELAQTQGEGWKIPALDPGSETLGVTDERDAEWLRSKLTAHPFRTLIEPAVLGNPKAEGIPRTFIFCTGNPPDGSFPRLARELKGRPDWKYMEINSSHSAMITAPEALAEKLLAVVG